MRHNTHSHTQVCWLQIVFILYFYIEVVTKRQNKVERLFTKTNVVEDYLGARREDQASRSRRLPINKKPVETSF